MSEDPLAPISGAQRRTAIDRLEDTQGVRRAKPSGSDEIEIVIAVPNEHWGLPTDVYQTMADLELAIVDIGPLDSDELRCWLRSGSTSGE